ncbi:hypothetical protein ACFQU7_37940 [Pseudoroseomonas wenyumeiae]
MMASSSFPAGQVQLAVTDEAEIAAAEPAIIGEGFRIGGRVRVVAGDD